MSRPCVSIHSPLLKPSVPNSPERQTARLLARRAREDLHSKTARRHPYVSNPSSAIEGDGVTPAAMLQPYKAHSLRTAPSLISKLPHGSAECACEATEKEDSNEQRMDSGGLHPDARPLFVPTSSNDSTAGLQQSVKNVLPSIHQCRLPTVATYVSPTPSLRKIAVESVDLDPHPTHQLELRGLRAMRSASPGSAPNQLPSISSDFKRDNPDLPASASVRGESSFNPAVADPGTSQRFLEGNASRLGEMVKQLHELEKRREKHTSTARELEERACSGEKVLGDLIHQLNGIQRGIEQRRHQLKGMREAHAMGTALRAETCDEIDFIQQAIRSIVMKLDTDFAPRFSSA